MGNSNMSNIDVIADDVIAVAAKLRETNLKQHLLAMVDHQGHSQLVELHFPQDSTATDRADLVRNVGANHPHTIAVIVIIESWMLMIKQEDYDADTYQLPSQSPDRVEAFVIDGTTSDGERVQIIDVFDRDPDTSAKVFRDPKPLLRRNVEVAAPGLTEAFWQGVKAGKRQ